MALSGYYLTIEIQQYSSGTASQVIAETTSINCTFNGDALETTVQSDALVSNHVGGKVNINVSGDWLVASDNEQFDALFAHADSGDIIDVVIYRNGTAFINAEGVLSSVSAVGANSDSLATGAYTMELSGSITTNNYVTAYQTVYNSFTTPPSSSVAAAQNTMVSSLVDAGLWSIIDKLHVWSAHTRINGEHLIDWKDPTKSATEPGEMNFVGFGGVQGNNTDKYLNSLYNPSVDAVNLSSLNYSFFYGVKNDSPHNNWYDFGARTDPNGWIMAQSQRADDGSFRAFMGTSSQASIFGDGSAGIAHFCITREAAGLVHGYVNSVKTDDNEAFSALPNTDMFVGAYSNGGVLTYPANRRYVYWGVGGLFSAAQWDTFYGIMETMLTSLHAGMDLSDEGSYATKQPIVCWVDDDGGITGKTILKPLLDAYGFKSCHALITDNIGSGPNQLDAADILQMHNEGFEFMAHSTSSVSLTTLSDAELIADFIEARAAIEAIIGSGNCHNHAYPNGAYNNLVRERAIDYHRSALSVGGENTYPIEYGALARHGVDSEDLVDLQAAVDNAITNNELLIFYGHSGGWDATRQGIVSDLIDYIHGTGVDFMTVNDALDVIETYHPNRWQPEKL